MQDFMSFEDFCEEVKDLTNRAMVCIWCEALLP